MKKLKLLSLLLFIAPVLAGCNQNQGGSGEPPAETDDYPITDYGTVSFNKKDYLCKGGQYGGFFAEVNVERALANNTEYEFTYESSYSTDKSYEITITNPLLAEVKSKDGKKFVIKTADAIGDFILKIENAQGILVYRNIIHVKRNYSVEYMPHRLYNIDYFQSDADYASWYGNWRLSFTEYEDVLKGTMTGGDELEQNVTITFTATYAETVEGTDSYLFSATTVETTASQTTIVSFLITRCSDIMYVYEDSGLLAILNACD